MAEKDFIEFDLENLAPDPAVKSLVDQVDKRQAERRMSKKEREQARRQLQRKEKDERKWARRRDKRVSYDLSPELIQRIAEIADQHRVPRSQVAALLLLHGITALEEGEIDIDAFKTPSKSPRYRWNLDLDK